MENQEALNPIEQYADVQRRISEGDVETAQQWAKGEFRELREQANSYVEPEEGISEESFVIPTQELTAPQEELQTETPAENIDESAEDFDREAHERQLYDAEVANYQAEIDKARNTALEIEKEREAERLKNDKLLKELEDARKAFDAEEDFFAAEPEPSIQAAEALPHVDTTVDNSELQEMKAELAQFKRQQQEKTEWDDTVKNYSSFWESSIGKDFAPEGKRETVMKDFNEFYSDIADNLSGKDAVRLLYDIRQNGMNDFYKEKIETTGARIPDEFNKMYDSMVIAQFAQGLQLDPKLGKFVDSGRGKGMSFEDAYFILNRDKVIAQRDKDAYIAVRNKLNEKNNAAIQVSPDQYSSIPTTSQRAMDPAYRKNLIAKAMTSGYKGGKLSDIKDPVIRQEMQEMHANIKQATRQQ